MLDCIYSSFYRWKPCPQDRGKLNPHPPPLPGSGRGVPHTQLARDLSLFRVLPVIEQTSVYYAAIRSELKAGRSPIPANDAWIAALARQPRMPIVTRDIHFDRVKNIERLAW